MQVNTFERLRLVYIIDNKAKEGFLGSHGLSIYVEAEYKDKSLSLVLDAGDSEEKLEHNLKILEKQGKISRDKIISVVLSHGHWDHGDGLPALLRFIGRKIPLIAHPDAFLKRISTVPYLRRVGLKYTAEELEQYGAYILKIRHPLEVIPGIFYSGEIPRVYEPSIDGVYFIQKNSNGGLIEDNIIDDVSLFGIGANTVFAVTGCGHAGILNIIKYLKDFFNSEKKGVENILITGGFHLMKKKKEDLIRIADKLLQITSAFRKVYFAPCHCTGEAFINVFQRRIKEIGINAQILLPRSGAEIIVTQEGIKLIL